MGHRNSRSFCKITAYRYNGKVYTSKAKFLDDVTDGIFFDIQHTVGMANTRKESGSWYVTRPALRMLARRDYLRAKIARRIDKLIK